MISLKAGLSWLITLALASTLSINLGIQLMHAGPRVRAEAESNLRLTHEFVLETIASAPAGESLLPALRGLYADLGSLRHVDIAILEDGRPAPAYWSQTNQKNANAAPDWFVALVGASPRMITVPITVGKTSYGRVAIVSNPLDELQEIWSDMTSLATISLIVSLPIFALALFILHHLLAPFGALQAGLSDLEADKDGVRIQPRGASEFRTISNALNSLASTLDRIRQENRQLVSELIEIQDIERKEIARDLHDEAGPCLFSIRAAANSLQELVAQPAPNLLRLREISAITDRASEALQSLFSGLLGRLRPKGLAELGLEAALKSLVASWKLGHPEIDLRLMTPHDLSPLDEPTAFAAYRVVQESVTNIFRHSGADWALIAVEFGCGDISDCGKAESENAPQLIITVEDNGVGIPQEHRTGFGLLGMRERLQRLGGSMMVARRSEGGARLVASLPIRDEDETI